MWGLASHSTYIVGHQGDDLTGRNDSTSKLLINYLPPSINSVSISPAILLLPNSSYNSRFLCRLQFHKRKVLFAVLYLPKIFASNFLLSKQQTIVQQFFNASQKFLTFVYLLLQQRHVFALHIIIITISPIYAVRVHILVSCQYHGLRGTAV